VPGAVQLPYSVHTHTRARCGWCCTTNRRRTTTTTSARLTACRSTIPPPCP